MKELTEAARGMREAMDEAKATYDDTVTSTMAAAGVADTYIGKLEEMEAAGLYWTAQRLGKKALAILTISDHIFTGEALNAQERQDSFHEMMEIALETAWKSLED